jgi:uncharacterized membrane protein YqgA involved in biofilm formation
MEPDRFLNTGSGGRGELQVIAVVINAVSVLVGSLIGLFFKSRIGERMTEVIYTAIGLSTLMIGFSMGLAAQRVLYLVLSLVIGGIVGTTLNIEGWILKLGALLHRLTGSGTPANGDGAAEKGSSGFAEGFLDASVLFCVGAMTILGCLQAGVEGKTDLLLIKSTMDGFIAILLAAAMGPGVAFSAVTILLYQGALTLGAGWISPFLSDLMLSELKGVGGVLVLMIGFNLLHIKRIRTANFIPAILFSILFCALDPWWQGFIDP